MTSTPRVLVITRPTDYEALLSRHGTREQCRFFLEKRGQSIDEVEARHRAFQEVLGRVSQAIPVRWRRTRVRRGELSRFVFEPNDVVVAVGQDGLIPNVAKYLEGQRVIGVNPDRARFDGLLVRHAVERVADLLADVAAQREKLELRTMVEARLDDGQYLVALNEVFVGHRTHQSARYQIALGSNQERHSSSGIVIATGTGATGWARSISRERRGEISLPSPSDPRLAYFVREAFPSVYTGTSLTQGVLDTQSTLRVISEMNEDGVVFGDGIEDDRLSFGWGICATISAATQRLHLVV